MSSNTGATTTPALHRTSAGVVSLEAFHGIIWGLFALCVVAFTCRAYIRLVCHRRLLYDDYLQLVAFGLLLGTAINGQMHLNLIYFQADVANGLAAPGRDFLDLMKAGLRAFAIHLILSYIGILAIKLGFIVFFYRIGSTFTKFLILWWAVLLLNIGCMAAVAGITAWDCLLGDINYISTACHSEQRLDQQQTSFKISIALDIFSDILIMCFPIIILWGAGISGRKKMILAATFSLIVVTIAITIVRGPIFDSAYLSSDSDKKVMSISWIWFWINMEFIAAFFVACLVSFRALFAKKESSANYAQARARSADERSSRLRVRANLLGSFNDTLRTFDGGNDHEMFKLTVPHSSGMDIGSRKDDGSATLFREEVDSVKSLQPVRTVSR